MNFKDILKMQKADKDEAKEPETTAAPQTEATKEEDKKEGSEDKGDTKDDVKGSIQRKRQFAEISCEDKQKDTTEDPEISQSSKKF